MSKMGSHDPFGHLKYKLWSKKIWLPTTKSRELTRFPCVQVACYIPLESSRRRLQLCFGPHINSRSVEKVMGPKVTGVPSLKISGVPGQNTIWMWPSWGGTEYTIRGKVVASPKSELWWVLWVRVCPWLVLAPKVLKLCTNQLIV
jgi:hypothetical protein